MWLMSASALSPMTLHRPEDLLEAWRVLTLTMKNLARAACVIATLAFPRAFAGDAVDVKPGGRVEQVEKKDRPTLEVVFVLDTTGSMGGLLEGAKAKIWSIASRMASGKPSPHIRVGLVAFRDRGDAYITKRLDLTDDLDNVYKQLQLLREKVADDLLLVGEMVEKGALADIRRFRDHLDRNRFEVALRQQLHRRLEKAFVRFGAAAILAVVMLAGF